MIFCRVFSNAFLAIPFFFLWNFLAPIYGTNLPLQYQHIPFWHCVGIFVLLGVVKSALFSVGHRFWHGRHHHHHYAQKSYFRPF
jgi:ABC-type dipeptide/oligopeptide/nickel transport system permease subunit